MSGLLSGESTVTTMEYHASSVFSAHSGGPRINPRRIQAHLLCERWINIRILRIVRYRSMACWAPEPLVNWVLLIAQMTGTMVAVAGSSSCVSHHQSLVLSSPTIRCLSMSAMWTSSEWSCIWNGWCTKGTVSNWTYPCSIVIWRYVNDVQSNYHPQAWNWVQGEALAGHLQIETIQFWSGPVQTSDVNPSTYSFAAHIMECGECCLLTEMDAMDSIVLSTCDTCCTSQWLCHMLSPQRFLIQLPAYEPLCLLNPGYMSDQASGGLWFLRREYLLVAVHQVHCLWEDH